MEMSNLDLVWVALCAGLVFLMQPGFMCLESGLTRSKNSINVAVKNIADFAVSVALFWAFGFALMFGLTHVGVIGTSGFLLPFRESGAGLTVFFLYQAMFCGTATTIASGAVAERMKFGGYLIGAIVLSSFIYPIFGHWAWGGIIEGESAGWLSAMGFVDFAGSTVVHSVGGWFALALVILLGPREGRFPSEGPPRKFTGQNIPNALLGVLLLWIGWIGFNGGSTLTADDSVPLILANTMLAGSAGLLAALAIGWPIRGRPEVDLMMNGSLAGLVAITANCHAVSAPSAFLIGAIAAVVMLACTWLLEWFRIDDVVGAIPVHVGAGVWGTLAVALFADTELLQTSLSRPALLGIQLLGIGTCFLWVFGGSFALMWFVNRLIPIRVTPEQEHIGLNVAEHGTTTETLDLLSVMDSQANTGDLSLRVPVEPFTEIGQIAELYNRVMETLQRTTRDLKRNVSELERSNEDLRQFAYAASHDLQEPLRAVAGYCQLLQMEAKDGLNAEALQFIHNAVEGTKRMQNLIHDLLDYSLVTTSEESFRSTDCNQVLQDVLSDLEAPINDAQAVVTCLEMPTINADARQLKQLFQNLMSNAIKYRGARRPEIRITAERKELEWLFAVMDNGIGVDSRHEEKVFAIFQRLHTQDAYPGSGIGLAICKRVVENHTGRIWFESELGSGSCFYFTIPDKRADWL
ncbi:MAG: histidine kinase [Planctomycetaceae bacterium]|nr:histidine kinase [Planctomycetaceae bacterium]